jgi:hypothetical protein
MNTYAKFIPNVFLAKCEEKYQRGKIINVQTKYGKENESIVFNLIFERNGFYYYSIVRSDGFDAKEYAKKRAERLQNASINAENKSTEYWKKSNKDSAFLSLGEPIKVGHHSENRHRKIIEQAQNNMSKCVEMSNKAESYESKISYWEHKANDINLSMPESIEYYEYKFEEVKMKHEDLKNGVVERSHSFSLTYAKKELNEATKKLELAKRLWR